MTLEERLRFVPETLPLLPVRDIVVYPYMMTHLFVGRKKSVLALEEMTSQKEGRFIVLAAQKGQEIDDPGPADLHSMGTVAECVQMLRLPDGTIRVVIEGLARAKLLEFEQTDPYLQVKTQIVPESEERGVELEALMRNVLAQFERAANLRRDIPQEALDNAQHTEEAGRLADVVAMYYPLKVEARQQILETFSPKQRLEILSELLNKEIEILEIERKISSRVKKELEDTQKEFYLREKIKAIQQELGERDERSAEMDDLRKQIEAAGMSSEVKEKALKELDRLEKMPPASPEVVVVRTYLDWLISLPWSKRSEDKIDINEAETILDQDHYGLKKIKERVLEFLAVRKLATGSKGPILCFIGPPGVGKTSIGRSIAKALGREFVRISLGGVRDESEIRGHRRTYVGALPGRIIQGMKTAGTCNPVFMMDEVDKIGVDFRGDPSAALLEVLDPEQNNAFSDHYLEVPFDLSEVMFITTGNLLDPVPPALKDRMEVIEFPGYIEEEKIKIAELFLVPKQRKEHGLDEKGLVFTENGLRTLTREYTREAGVRNLEREVASISRKVAKKIAQGKTRPLRITPSNIAKFLGPPRFRFGTAEKKPEVAVATGLGWTQSGGDTMPVEVTLMKGEGNLLLTGCLGEVMQESGKAALSYARSRAVRFGLDENFYSKCDVHIHVPQGAQPKEGPSAGLAIAVALISALTNRPVRCDVAITGEITLRGKVLPIGGVKEKVLAAHRAGIKVVLLPKDNEKDMEEIPTHVKKDLEFCFIESADEAIEIALLPPKDSPAAKETRGKPSVHISPHIAGHA
ncbi:MAG: endopeptidase La [Armatimonadetes bacterium]|nr:endopeptidase La [Armatimonadota bacterium]NIM22747.1 endopeptidase La [Armatimonadota bacterium]NIM66572.1 endopeptidase La [Armatimonadota bacterium]NIM75173.1 endopeptidase La [Armatimonadota bacterium]NIN04797.1 endopeptidase La [Armatimonadota bacterium]